MAAAAAVLLASLAVAAQSPNNSPATLAADPRERLLDKLSNVAECGQDCRWKIADVLGKPKNKTFLLSEFQKSTNQEQRLGIIYALYRLKGHDVAGFFRGLVREKYDDGEELYYPLNYLAKQCDRDALRVLSGDGHGGDRGYPGCMQWGTTVEVFGKCMYRPAIPYLISSIHAACLNIGIAAVEDLRKLYPGSPSFKNYSLDQIERYFRQRATAEFPPEALPGR
jgi:hypothetical protein